MLNISVSSANRINYLNSSFGRTLLGTLVTAKCGLPGGTIVLSSKTMRSGISLLRPDHELTSGNFRICTARKATHFLGRGNIPTVTIR